MPNSFVFSCRSGGLSRFAYPSIRRLNAVTTADSVLPLAHLVRAIYNGRWNRAADLVCRSWRVYLSHTIRRLTPAHKENKMKQNARRNIQKRSRKKRRDAMKKYVAEKKSKK